MKGMELLHDQSSVDRGNELITLIQESSLASETLRLADQYRANYFDITVGQLIDSAPHENMMYKNYADLGRAVLKAKLTQDHYEKICDDYGLYNPELESIDQVKRSLVEDFLLFHRYKPIVAASLPDCFPIHSHRFIGKESPFYANGYVNKDFGDDNNTIFLSSASRIFRDRKNLYHVKVLREGVPRVALAIGE